MRPSGVYLRFGSQVDEATNERVHSVTRKLLLTPLEGVTDLVPGYASLYVEYDSARLSGPEVRRWLDRAGDDVELGGRPDQRDIVELPVVYDGEDLGPVASALGLDPAEVAAIHAEPTYRVYATGFLPGFPFLGEVPAAIRLPRHSRPRRAVPAHSLAMAGSQTGIYPLSSPGGWQLLGHALKRLYDPVRKDPFLLEPGDRVRFIARQSGEAPAAPQVLQLLPEEPLRPVFLVQEPGLLDLVVDPGRQMMGRFGLARSGPLDSRSAWVANALLGNRPAEALLELNLHGPVLECLSPVVAAFAGYALVPRVNGEAIEPFRSFGLLPGDVLSFGTSGSEGCRGYLAIAGGIEARSFAGSSSVDLRGLIGRPLEVGDVLGRASSRQSRAGRSFTPHRRQGRSLRLLPGPQASREAARALAASEYVIAESDRVGLRLEGPAVPGGEVVSEAVPLGALQVPPNGSPILLLNDRGSLGGYEKPALLHPDDLPLAGQLRTGNWVRFRPMEGEWGD